MSRYHTVLRKQLAEGSAQLRGSESAATAVRPEPGYSRSKFARFVICLLKKLTDTLDM